MEKIIYSSQFFNILDTLECGQIFRFKPFNEGYLVYSREKCAYCYSSGENTVIECNNEDLDYFQNYFDLQRDYSLVYNRALSQNIEVLTVSAKLGKGIRILNQDKEEMLYSFMISQNNNIPRIKGIIEKLCFNLGEKKSFYGVDYYTFPKSQIMASQSLEFFNSIGLGYRSQYILGLAKSINDGTINVDFLSNLKTCEVKNQLLNIKGIGEKVANCVLLFGFNKTDSFPVDTWTDKVYRENFKGSLTDRKKITEYFVNAFGEDSGIFQQYLFYYKRSLEKNNKTK